MEEQKNTENEVLTPEDAKALAPLYSDVIKALKQVYDPEIPVNIYDLGLIYELVINKAHDVFIKMTFTAPNCPMADDVLADVKASVEDVPGIKSCNIELVFEPAWDKSMLSEEARIDPSRNPHPDGLRHHRDSPLGLRGSAEFPELRPQGSGQCRCDADSSPGYLQDDRTGPWAERKHRIRRGRKEGISLAADRHRYIDLRTGKS